MGLWYYAITTSTCYLLPNILNRIQQWRRELWWTPLSWFMGVALELTIGVVNRAQRLSIWTILLYTNSRAHQVKISRTSMVLHYLYISSQYWFFLPLCWGNGLCSSEQPPYMSAAQSSLHTWCMEAALSCTTHKLPYSIHDVWELLWAALMYGGCSELHPYMEAALSCTTHKLPWGIED